MSVVKQLSDDQYEYIDCKGILVVPLTPSDCVVSHSVNNNSTLKNGASPAQDRSRVPSPNPPVVQQRARNRSPDPPSVRSRSRNHSHDPPEIQPRTRNHSHDPPAVGPRPNSLDSHSLTTTKQVSINPSKNVHQPTEGPGKRSVSPRRQHSYNPPSKANLKQRPDFKAKPLNIPSSSNANSSSTALLPDEGENSDGGETLMLPDLVRKYSKCLPLRIHVKKGYRGSEERFVISSGDIYNFHFMKSEKVASIQDCGNHHFSIPFNSDIEFGLLFDPSNDFDKALKGHTFASVSELVASKTMPKIIRVVSSQTNIGNKKLSLVKPNELLIVKKIGKTMLRKPFLKVYSCTNKEEKTLLDDCDASFTTEPKQVKLYLLDLLEQFTDSLPLEAMMFPSAEDLEDFPLHLITEKIVITHISIESAIIATKCWDLEDTDMALNHDSEQTTPISIPVDLELELTILNVNDEDLYQNTKSFISNFDLSMVEDMKMGEVSAENMAEVKKCQNKLSKKIRQGYELHGVDITMSDKVYDGQAMPFRSVIKQPLPPLPKTANLQTPHPGKNHISSSPKPVKKTKESPCNRIPIPPVRGQSLDGDQAVGGIKNPMTKMKNVSDEIEESPTYNNQSQFKFFPPSVSPNLPMAIPTSTVSSDDDTHHRNLIMIRNPSEDEVIKLGLRVNSLKTLTEARQNDYQKQLGVVREDVKLLTELVEGLRAECEFLRMELEQVKRTTSIDTITTGPPSLQAVQTTTAIIPLSPEQEKENLKALRALSNKQIINLLDAMKLTKYKESFEEECIDGEVFVECDENILEKELGIHNRLHRTRLMKLITGRHSTQYYFTDNYDPYGRLLTLV